LQRYRDYVVSRKGAELDKAVNDLLEQGTRLDDPALQRVPAGYRSEHPRGRLYRIRATHETLTFDHRQSVGLVVIQQVDYACATVNSGGELSGY
jgi:hypothetical protein